MRVELSCAECGENNFSLDEAVSDQTQIICRNCGHEVGTFGHVKELVLAELRHPPIRRSEIVLGREDEREAS